MDIPAVIPPSPTIWNGEGWSTNRASVLRFHCTMPTMCLAGLPKDSDAALILPTSIRISSVISFQFTVPPQN
jgi:hypothetical protein